MAQLVAATDRFGLCVRCHVFFQCIVLNSHVSANLLSKQHPGVLSAAFMYVLVPMPYLFFGTDSSSSSSIYGGSSMASG